MRASSRTRSRLVLVGLMALALIAPANAASAAPAKHGKQTRAVRLAPAPEKDAAIVVDGATGKVLYARNPDSIRYPASLTKMMTLYLLFEAIDRHDVITVSAGALKDVIRDHIGFDGKNLEAFCKKLEAAGIKLDRPYTKNPQTGAALAFVTDPWGTSIEMNDRPNPL